MRGSLGAISGPSAIAHRTRSGLESHGPRLEPYYAIFISAKKTRLQRVGFPYNKTLAYVENSRHAPRKGDVEYNEAINNLTILKKVLGSVDNCL